MRKKRVKKDLIVDSQPRQRLTEYGAGALSVQELLAIFLGNGNEQQKVMTLAQKVFAYYGSLEKMAASPIEELQSIKGVGQIRACLLKAGFELGRRYLLESQGQFCKKYRRPIMYTPMEVFKLIRGKLMHVHKEHFVALSFDSQKRLLGIDTISIGTLNASLVHPREVFDAAISRHAASLIMAHNHPSGDLEPSKEDIKITKRLVEAGKIMGIEMLDHIIVSQVGYTSFKERGLM